MISRKKGKGKKTNLVEKENCPECKDLPEGEVAKGHDHRAIDVEATDEIQESLIEDVEEEMPEDRRDPRFSQFKVKKIIIQEGGRVLHLEVMKTFDKIYTNYLVEMTVDLDTIDWRIEQKKKEKQSYENQNQMDAFDDMKKRELEEYDRRIEMLETERNERIAQSPKISFEGKVKSDARKLNSTDFVFVIPSDVVGSLNDQFNFMANYKIELIKNLNNE